LKGLLDIRVFIVESDDADPVLLLVVKTAEKHDVPVIVRASGALALNVTTVYAVRPAQQAESVDRRMSVFAHINILHCN